MDVSFEGGCELDVQVFGQVAGQEGPPLRLHRLARAEVHFAYQPRIDLASGRIRSVEALLRWNHPLRGLVSPMELIPLAEENGLFEQIGHWVLRTACAGAAGWRSALEPWCKRPAVLWGPVPQGPRGSGSRLNDRYQQDTGEPP